MNPIQTLSIHGFKSIQLLDNFNLKPLNILIGANGAGKSNFISYFRLLHELVEQRLQVWTAKQGGAERIVSFGLKETSEIKSNLLFGRNGYEIFLEPTAEGGFTFVRERLYFEGDYGKSRPNLGSGHKESLLKAEMRSDHYNIASYCYKAISRWTVFHFHDTSETSGIKRLGSLHDNDYLRFDASNLAAFLYRIAEEYPTVYQHIRQIIRLAIPFFDDFVLKPQKLPTEEQQIRLLWRQKESDYAFWPNQLSDGSIRFMSLVTALLQPKPPSTLIVDEPELGLHPYAITLLGSLLRSASKRIQIIVCTQSVPLVNEFAIEDLIVVEREQGATVFKRYDEKDFERWLQEYSVGELWGKNLLGGRPYR